MRWSLLLVLAACDGAPDHKLPGASLTPELDNRTPASACATEFDVDGDGRSDGHWQYRYDDRGRLAHADGNFVGGGQSTIDYEFDNLDRMTHSLQVMGDASAEVTALYNTLGDLIEYTLAQPDRWEHYTYAGFDDFGHPTRETSSSPKAEFSTTYQVHYDAAGRIALVMPETGGSATVYSYDDDARTITIDTDDGAYRGVIELDDRDRELSETWDGTDPSVIANSQTYEWSGDRLIKATARSGTQFAPHELRVIEVDTYRYDCR
jgi:hypothetical protein